MHSYPDPAWKEKMPKISWGIISCADIGLRAVVPALRKSNNGRVAAIASRDLSRAQQAAAAHEIPRAYGSYDELLADPGIDAVYIPVPNSEHARWTIRALEQGKHVLCEKPLAMNTREVDAIAQAASAQHRLVMEALMYPFHPQTERVAEIVRSGVLGAVQLSFCRVYVSRPESPGHPPQARPRRRLPRLTWAAIASPSHGWRPTQNPSRSSVAPASVRRATSTKFLPACCAFRPDSRPLLAVRFTDRASSGTRSVAPMQP